MFGALASCESQNRNKHGSTMPEGLETTMSRKREGSPGLGLTLSVIAEDSGSACGQKRRQTSQGVLACSQSAQAPSEGKAVLHDINEPSSPLRHNLLQVSYGAPSCSSAKPAQHAAAASTAFGFGRQSTQIRGHLPEHWSSGVSADADCFAFQHDDMDFKSADDSWLESSDTKPQDCPQPELMSANAGAPPLPSSSFPFPFPFPSPSPCTARPLTPQQHAVKAAEGHQSFVQRHSGCLALKHSSQPVCPSPVGKHDAAISQQQQQQAGRTAAFDPRLSYGAGSHGNPSGQGPMRQGRAPAFSSPGSAPFTRGWTRICAPIPSQGPTPASNQGSRSTVYQFQGSSSSGGVQASSVSQVEGLPQPAALLITPPGTSPIPNSAAAPHAQAGGARPGTAPLQPHQQQQQQQQEQQYILTRMQQCITFIQKMQQLLLTGKSASNEPLTDEQRAAYQKQGNTVVAQYNRLVVQYHSQHSGMVEGVWSGQPTEILINQQRLAAEAARLAASLQGPAQGAAQGAPPPAQRGPSCTPAGWNAGMVDHGNSSFAGANAVADDYDRDLQAALAASVADQPGEWVPASDLTVVKPDEKPGDKGPTAIQPSRAVPRNPYAAEEAAQVDEITRLTAEPLMLRAQNGGGVVWQNEKDLSMPRVAPPTPPTPQENVTPGGVTACPDTATEVETNLVSAPAAALPIPASAEADSTPGDSHIDSDSCAEKVAELSLEANPAGLQLAKEVKEEEEDLSLLKALSTKELQAYGPQSESGYMSSDLCEDVDDLNISDGGSDASDGAVSDTCSEEQEDFQAVRLVADEEAASQATELQDDWVLAEADGPEWI